MMQPVTIRDYAALRRALTARRLALELSVEDLAAASGLPASSIRRLERGFCALGDKSLPGILAALRLEMAVAPRIPARAA